MQRHGRRPACGAPGSLPFGEACQANRGCVQTAAVGRCGNGRGRQMGNECIRRWGVSAAEPASSRRHHSSFGKAAGDSSGRLPSLWQFPLSSKLLPIAPLSTLTQAATESAQPDRRRSLKSVGSLPQATAFDMASKGMMAGQCTCALPRRRAAGVWRSPPAQLPARLHGPLPPPCCRQHVCRQADHPGLAEHRAAAAPGED
jgi:hypothetical protein